MYVQDIAKEVKTGSPYRWTIPETITPGNYYIYATAVNLRDVPVKEVYDFSDNAFSIVATPIDYFAEIISPNGGEILDIGKSTPIKWSTRGYSQ